MENSELFGEEEKEKGVTKSPAVKENGTSRAVLHAHTYTRLHSKIPKPR